MKVKFLGWALLIVGLLALALKLGWPATPYVLGLGILGTAVGIVLVIVSGAENKIQKIGL